MMKRIFLMGTLLGLAACQQVPVPTVAEAEVLRQVVEVRVSAEGQVFITEGLEPQAFLTNNQEIVSSLQNIAAPTADTFTFDFVVSNNSANAWSDFRLGRHPLSSPRAEVVGFDTDADGNRFEAGELLYDAPNDIDTLVEVRNGVFATDRMEPVGSGASTSFTAKMAVRYTQTPFSLYFVVEATDPSKPILVDKDAVGYTFGAQRYYDGATWATAYPTLQAGLARARNSSAKEVWVAEGVYYPDDGPATNGVGAELANPDNNRNASFALSSGLQVYGGFNGTETVRGDRDPAANLTVLSGDIDQNDSALGGVVQNPGDIFGDNAFRVFSLTDAALDGVTVTGGLANGSFGTDQGAGGSIAGTSSTLRDVVLQGNTAVGNGGALTSFAGSATLTDVRFINNSAAAGGAIRIDFGSTYRITNAVFVGNSATNAGGAIAVSGSTLSLVNTTLTDNTAGSSGGAIAGVSDTLLVENSILWDNRANGSPNQIFRNSSSPIAVDYSLVQDGDGGISDTSNSNAFASGTGNLNAQPLFTGVASGTPRLSSGSPAIDAGNNASVPVGITTDLDGNQRVQDGNNDAVATVDMGAYERPPVIGSLGTTSLPESSLELSPESSP